MNPPEQHHATVTQSGTVVSVHVDTAYAQSLREFLEAVGLVLQSQNFAMVEEIGENRSTVSSGTVIRVKCDKDTAQQHVDKWRREF
jgi:hypothetical protein